MDGNHLHEKWCGKILETWSSQVGRFFNPSSPLTPPPLSLSLSLFLSLCFSGITDEEKVVVRATLLQCVEEPVQQVLTRPLATPHSCLMFPKHDYIPHIIKGCGTCVFKMLVVCVVSQNVST